MVVSRHILAKIPASGLSLAIVEGGISMRTSHVSPAPDVRMLTAASPPALLADLMLTVVTPMFGGGVSPGEHDLENLIRPSSVRGHLRFWWRACNAAAYASIEELARAERRLWGSMAKRIKDHADPDFGTFGTGGIGIRVTVEKEKKGAEQTHSKDTPSYVVWPFAEQEDPPIPARKARTGITFRLRLFTAAHVDRHDSETDLPFVTPDECQQAAEQALWAWIAFGGVGARTRRGCGTLYCAEDGPDGGAIPASALQPQADPHQWLKDRRDALVPRARKVIPNVPCLVGSTILVGLRAQPTANAWSTAVEPMRDFLQGEGVGRNPRPSPNSEMGKDNTPGQSYWPEVGAVRTILSVAAGPHHYSRHAGTGENFPRSDLGLPRAIKTGTGKGAPTGTIEAGRDRQSRMASPVVLKSLAISDTRAIPLVLMLTAPHPWSPGAPGIRINGRKSLVLTPRPLNDPYHPPTWPRALPPCVDGATSARDAFMAYVTSRSGWKAVP